LKKVLVSLISLVILAAVVSLVIQNIHAVSNIQQATTTVSNIGKNFQPWSMIVSIVLPLIDNTSGKNSDAEQSDSFKYTSVSSSSETRTVRTGFSYLQAFKFSNDYINYYGAIPDRYIPDFIHDGDYNLQTYGRCGGMAFTALDYWIAHQRIPGWDSTPTTTPEGEDPSPGNPAAFPPPSNDSPLSKYILQRLYDSLDLNLLGILKSLVSIGLTSSPASSVSDLENGPRFLYLQFGPTENKGTFSGYCTIGCLPGVRPLTDKEVIKATHILDQKKPVVFGLISGTSKNPGNNHQVVAYGYHYDKALNGYTFFIWDNNKPNMEVMATWYLGVKYGKLYYGYQYFDDKKGGFVLGKFDNYPEGNAWKGFFVEDYTPKTPPVMFIDLDQDGIDDSKDNCSLKNPDQLDTNKNGVGDACEYGDIDHDGVIDSKDNCKYVANPDQKDEDNNGVGDACKDVIL
jgi:hypothetical protein